MRSKNTFGVVALAIVITAIATSAADAGLRAPFEDEQVVERSELIAVAHLKPKSIEYVPHKVDRNNGRSWEHHAVLVLDETLKGKSDAKEIPITIHYGLTPVEDGHWEHDGSVVNVSAHFTHRGDARGVVEIMDTGNSAWSATPIVPDASKPQIWFLRKLGGKFGRDPGNPDSPFGIIDPEDLQRIELKPYLQCYLADDPEPAVRTYLQRDPSIAERALRYFSHREVERIQKLADPAIRVERLMPYWRVGQRWGLKSEAEEGLIAAGEVAGPYLAAAFDTNLQTRQPVISLWGRIKYRRAVPTLVKLLESHDKFWASQKLERNWWNGDTDAARRSERQRIYGETYAAVWALRTIGDRSATDVIRQTLQRWTAINFENDQIVEACNDTLKDWAGGDEPAGAR